MNLTDIIDVKACSSCNGRGEVVEFRGDLMAAARREAGIKGVEMALRLGLTPQRLQAKEKGERERFTEDEARQFLAVLNGGG